ncbi:MAG: hypothetical protein ACTHNU_10090 [Gaiellales bacterium]
MGAAGAYVVTRARRMAELEGRPLTDVLPELPKRLANDVATIPADLKMAANEGRLAGERRVHELDEMLRVARAPQHAADPAESAPEPLEPPAEESDPAG